MSMQKHLNRPIDFRNIRAIFASFGKFGTYCIVDGSRVRAQGSDTHMTLIRIVMPLRL